MARRTFADFDEELRIALAKRSDFTSTIRKFVLDSAYYFVANVIRHRELETEKDYTLAAPFGSLTIDADLWFPEYVYNNTDRQELTQRNLRLFQNINKPIGNPGAYDVFGPKMYFDRKVTSDKTIHVMYTKRPAEPILTASSALDVLYDQLIVMYAIKFAFEELRDYDQASKQMLAINVYEGRIKPPWRMMKTDDSHKGIRVRMR